MKNIILYNFDKFVEEDTHLDDKHVMVSATKTLVYEKLMKSEFFTNVKR